MVTKKWYAHIPLQTTFIYEFFDAGIIFKIEVLTQGVTAHFRKITKFSESLKKIFKSLQFFSVNFMGHMGALYTQNFTFVSQTVLELWGLL